MVKLTTKNVVNSATDVMVSIINTVNAKCWHYASNSIKFTVVVSDGGVIDNLDFKAGQSAYIDQTCIATGKADSDIDQQLSKIIKQLAETTTNAFPPIGGSDTENLTNSYSELATTVRNSYSLDCRAALINSADIKVTVTGQGSEIKDAVLDVNQVNDALQNCILKSDIVTQASQKVEESFDQSAKTKVTGIFGSLAVLFIVIILIIFGFIFKAVGSVFNPKFLIAVVIIVVVWLVIAVIFKWWPVHHKGPKKNLSTGRNELQGDFSNNGKNDNLEQIASRMV